MTAVFTEFIIVKADILDSLGPRLISGALRVKDAERFVGWIL